jgi:hypothetical protein
LICSVRLGNIPKYRNQHGTRIASTTTAATVATAAFTSPQIIVVHAGGFSFSTICVELFQTKMVNGLKDQFFGRQGGLAAASYF